MLRNEGHWRMHYQLFFPGKFGNSASCLRLVGLADFVDGANEMPLTGRDGEPSGLLVSWGDVPKWEPAKQSKVDATGYQIIFWTGADGAVDVTPAEIVRQSTFSGYVPKLSDCNQWLVPVAADLPSGLRLVDGHWTKVRKPQFVDFWNQSEKWYRRSMLFNFDLQKMANDASMTVNAVLDEMVEFAVFALRQNYRINAEIASAIGLLSTQDVDLIVGCVIDKMAIQEVLDEMQHLQDIETTQKKEGDSVTQGS